jgi:hypothetical protein
MVIAMSFGFFAAERRFEIRATKLQALHVFRRYQCDQ